MSRMDLRVLGACVHVGAFPQRARPRGSNCWGCKEVVSRKDLWKDRVRAPCASSCVFHNTHNTRVPPPQSLYTRYGCRTRATRVPPNSCPKDNTRSHSTVVPYSPVGILLYAFRMLVRSPMGPAHDARIPTLNHHNATTHPSTDLLTVPPTT